MTLKLIEIEEITKINDTAKVYDIEVEEDHSFCITTDNLCVHNSHCRTFNKTGVGYKQFSVALECSQIANELQALICSDGGCKQPGDICKALGAGAHLVCAGTIFAGTDECVGDWRVDNNGEKKFMFYGMSSKVANDKHFGGLKEYRTSEGKETWIDGKGPVSNVVQDILGGLASVCTYTNTKNIENLSKNCDFTY